jgi:proline racemase
MSSLFDQWTWKPAIDWQKINTTDTHADREATQIIVASSLSIQGRNVLGKRQYFLEKHDHIRTGFF